MCFIPVLVDCHHLDQQEIWLLVRHQSFLWVQLQRWWMYKYTTVKFRSQFLAHKICFWQQLHASDFCEILMQQQSYPNWLKCSQDLIFTLLRLPYDYLIQHRQSGLSFTWDSNQYSVWSLSVSVSILNAYIACVIVQYLSPLTAS